MNIYIVTNDSFPFGRAATNRIHSYCKGFIINNATTKVICVKPNERLENGNVNKEVKSIISDIPYEYPSGTNIRGKTFLKRRWLVLKGIIQTFYILTKENAKKKIDALIIYTNSLGYIIYFFIVSKILQITYILEKSEYPIVLKKTTLIGRLYAKLYVNYLYKVFDAIIVETKTLKKYYKPRIRKNARMMIAPMTVEPERFNNNVYPRPDKSEYIAYCGSLDANKKDGISILIKAFSKISNKYKNLKLYVIGYSDSKGDFEKLQKLVFELNISDKVIFTGKVKRDEITKYLINATILALAKTSDYISTGGLSSKIAEYLSTGDPVVMTNVGDISDFLTDEENVFFSEPDSVEKFADRLDYVLSHPEIAKRVGQKGREIALKYFNYKTQAKRIINFIDKLNQR